MSSAQAGAEGNDNLAIQALCLDPYGAQQRGEEQRGENKYEIPHIGS